MAKTYDNSTIVILDIGKNIGSAEDKKFFEKAKQCASRLIERNIMLQSKNLVGVLLMGAGKTDNELASQCPGAFKYINMASELKVPTWQMIRDLPNETTEKKSDWFEALIVAAHHYKDGISGYKINSKKVVLITNFQHPARIGKNFDDVINGFQEENYEVYVIGPDLESDEIKDVEPVRSFIEKTNGDTATFEEAMSSWLFHKKKASKMIPQNFDLSIGPNVKIPISMYIRVKDEPIVKSWQKAVKDAATLTASTTEGVKTDRKIINTENQAVLEPEETIEGYQYGQKIIPFSEDDKAMLYKSGERSLSVYGFTKNDIQWQNLSGDCTYYMFGRKGDKNAQHAIKCLVHCLHETKLVGIVRKVHCKNSEPKMFMLSPVIDANDFVCLSLIEICYKETIKHMGFPPTNLKKYAHNNEQVKAFKELIGAMDLTNAYDDSFNDAEAFPIAETVSPSSQYILDCIAYRAMNPGKPLPEPREEIMTLFKIPPLIVKRSEDAMDKVMKLLTLNKIEKTVKKRVKASDLIVEPTSKDQDVPMVDAPKVELPSTKEDVEKIGTIEPTRDFQILLNKGKTLAELTPEFTEIIEHLVYANFSNDYTRVVGVMKCLREECVKNCPALYNDWLQKFKKDLMERKREALLEVIQENEVNFILKSENEESAYDGNDDSQLYDNDTIPNSTELTVGSEVNDLFDEM